VTLILSMYLFTGLSLTAGEKFILTANFSKPAGKIRPLNGVNNGPFVDGNHTAVMNTRHKEAAFPSV